MVKVGLHQGSSLSPFLFAVFMDRLTNAVRQQSLWAMMFADNIVICSNRERCNLCCLMCRWKRMIRCGKP